MGKRGCALILLCQSLCLTGCSLGLDFDGECLTDRGCDSLGERLVCVDQACVSDKSADPRLPEDALTEQCNLLFGAASVAEVRAGDYVVLGALLPAAGLLTRGRPAIEAAIEMATADINQAGGVNGSRIAILGCDESVQAATYLVRTLQLDAVIGATQPDLAGPLFRDMKAAEENALLLTVGAPDPTLASLADDNLLWRAKTSSDVAARAAATISAEDDLQRLAIVFDQGSWGRSTAAVFNGAWCADAARCSADRFAEFAFDPTAIDADALRTRLDAANTERAVVIAGPDSLVPVLEALAMSGVRDVITIDGLATPAVLRAFLQLGDDGESMLDPASYAVRAEITCRHLGLTAGGVGPEASPWRIDFETRNPGVALDPLAPIYADAVYLLSYAVAAARGAGSGALTGGRLSDGLGRLSGGAGIKIGGGNWALGVRVLDSSASATLNYRGASGELDFDANGDAPGPTNAWRFNIDRVSAESAGVVRTVGGEARPIDDRRLSEDCACAPFRTTARCEQ